jgi:hypothetical protein
VPRGPFRQPGSFRSRGIKNVLSDLSELLLGPLRHSLGHVLSESVSQ